MPLTYSQLMPKLKKEIRKPFSQKLEHSKKMVSLFADKNACVSCSWGKDSMVVLSLCRESNPDIAVVYENTCIDYPEVYPFRDRMVKEWDLNLVETKPEIGYFQIPGPRANGVKNGHNTDRCCETLKIKPFQKVLKKFGWRYDFTGMTAFESRQRAMRLCELGDYYYHKTDGVWRVQPLAFWTPSEVWRYTKKMGIPVCPSYKKYGLKRLGCKFCTSHKGWRKEMSSNFPKVYDYICKTYFNEVNTPLFSFSFQTLDAKETMRG